LPVGLSCAGAQGRRRIHADERVAAPYAARGSRFHQKGAGPTLRQGAVQADGRERVGQHRDGHWDHAAVRGHGAEGLAGWGNLAKSFHQCSSSTCSSRGLCGAQPGTANVVPGKFYSGRLPITAGSCRSVKQDSVPVWHAAPTWSTWISSASPSQSMATDFTNW